MTTILLIGDKEDNELEALILGTLSMGYQITFIKDNKVSRHGSGYEILVIDTEYLTNISLNECIIVAKTNAVMPDIDLPEKSIVIASSDNSRLLEKLGELKAHVITCGSSKRDSVSYSSLTADGIVISLNREIIAFSGKKIEPLEIPAHLSVDPEHIYNPMAFTALRLLLDDYNSEIGLLY